MTPSETGPVFGEMSRAEALRLLRANAIGRIAYSLHDRVEVQPIFYVSDGRWLYARTSPGFKLSVLAHNRWLALQTDQVESMFSWRSVLVHGTVYVLSPDATPDLARRYNRAVRKIREQLPATLTTSDPVGFRSVFLGIHIDSITGRQASETSSGGRGLRGGRRPARGSSSRR
jgi:nitroimidazol reductase NimA-like FMN-containing flavoprotein (pyridoxamine 5'-phosphate oxidase superfamily)